MSSENRNLRPDQLEEVTGGRKNTSVHTVEAICEHCGAKGPHKMNSGWTAICRKCGKSINLKAQ